jgi:hypothetical protein
MKKSEAWYEGWLRADSGNVTVRFEPVKLRLAAATFYTPDFMVTRDDGEIVFHEVKGGWWEDDARVKIKVAAEMYPEFRFIAAVVKKRGGKYELEREEAF